MFPLCNHIVMACIVVCSYGREELLLRFPSSVVLALRQKSYAATSRRRPVEEVQSTFRYWKVYCGCYRAHIPLLKKTCHTCHFAYLFLYLLTLAGDYRRSGSVSLHQSFRPYSKSLAMRPCALCADARGGSLDSFRGFES